MRVRFESISSCNYVYACNNKLVGGYGEYLIDHVPWVVLFGGNSFVGATEVYQHKGEVFSRRSESGHLIKAADDSVHVKIKNES